jgi:hypothetical protein
LITKTDVCFIEVTREEEWRVRIAEILSEGVHACLRDEALLKNRSGNLAGSVECLRKPGSSVDGADAGGEPDRSGRSA